MNHNPHSSPHRIPLSVLDLVPVPAGTAPSQALRRVTDLAQLAERLGYVRYWFSEHHAMPSVASSAPEILIAHVAAATQSIRVGSGGMMLPNHPPLRIAEVFHTLAALYPGRIDLGLGRAPGGVPGASRALRAADGAQFGQQLGELFAFSRPPAERQGLAGLVHAEPSDASLPPVWLLGSSGASAQMAGAAGLGYGFASHFSPTPAAPALLAYRQHFRPSEAFPRPHAILGAAVVCAPTDEEARYLAGTMELAWLRIQMGRFEPLPSPESAAAYPFSDYEREAVADYRRLSIVGSPASVRAQLLPLIDAAQADELMVVSNIHGHAQRLRSYELLAEAMR